MARILLTAGPTRAYLDAVRFLTNAVRYPRRAKVIPVVTTEEMLEASLAQLPWAEGIIAAAAPCDFGPAARAEGKIPRAAAGITLRLEPSTDVIATLASRGRRPAGGRRKPWCVAFALEPGADVTRARGKLAAKHCDLIVVNDLPALESASTAVSVHDAGQEVGRRRGTKAAVAAWLIRLIEQRLG
jgi:phosphopantothenoylcysteine decarboxylase/phosphopantothenate--cysteine ligase